MFDSSFILFFVVITLIIGLGSIIFYQDKKNILNRSFVYFTLAMAVWVASNYLQDEDASGQLQRYLVKIDYSSAIIMAYLFFVFMLNFSLPNLNIEAKRLKAYKILLFCITLAIAIASLFSRLIIKDIEILPGVVEPIYGIFYFSYLFVMSAFIVLGLSFLFVKFRKAPEGQRKEIPLVFMGFGIMILIMVITNLVLINYIKEIDNFVFYSRLGVYSVLILIGFISYAMTRNNFLNTKVLAARIFSFSISVVFFVQIFSFNSYDDLFIKLVFFVLVLYFSKMLMDSVKLEVKRKEELQEMSSKLAIANDQLRKLDNAKSEFISIASHQLRTPLTAIKGFVSMLLEGAYGKLQSQQEEALNKAYTSNDRLIHLVEDLLNVSRMESGRMEFKFAPTKMEDLCQEIIDTFVLRAKDKKLYLQYKKPGTPLPELMIDAGKVKEVVSNMVDNALKYTLRGGVTLKLSQEGDWVRVTVSDTGIGIPATELPYLFSKFSRGKDVGRLNTGGTGLGLYVGKGMIENNGGKIWAESEGEGKGSRFIIELPIRQSKELLGRWS